NGTKRWQFSRKTRPTRRITTWVYLLLLVNLLLSIFVSLCSMS
ncbi:unnamed protein product, partial [Allacma fusca]